LILRAKYPSYGFLGQLWGTDQRNQETGDLDVDQLCVPEIVHFETLEGIDGEELLEQLVEMGYEIRYPKKPESDKPKRKTLNTAKSLIEQEQRMTGKKPVKQIEEHEPATYSEMAKANSSVTTGMVAKSSDPSTNRTLHKK